MLKFDLRGAKNVLFLGAHSDDIEIGCGGTILTLAEAYPGLNILWAVFSAEGKRRPEARSSSQHCSLKELENAKASGEAIQGELFPAEFDRIKTFCESLKSFRQTSSLRIIAKTGTRIIGFYPISRGILFATI